MKILVIGANGQIGKKIVEKLHKNSHHDPVAMIRKKEQSDHFAKFGIEYVLGDLEEDFSHAVEGCDAVIFSAGSGADTGKDKTEAIDHQGALKAVDLATKKGAKRFVMISTMGADKSPQEWPKEMAHYYQAKSSADDYLIQSNLTYTILRPGKLTNDQPTGKVELDNKPLNESGSISRSDVAELVVKALDTEKSKHETFDVISGNVEIKEALETLK